MSNNDQKPSFSGDQKPSFSGAQEQKPVAYDQMSTEQLADLYLAAFNPLSQKRLRDRFHMIERLQEEDAKRATHNYEEMSNAQLSELFSVRFDVQSQKRLTDRNMMIECLRRDDQARQHCKKDN